MIDNEELNNNNKEVLDNRLATMGKYNIVLDDNSTSESDERNEEKFEEVSLQILMKLFKELKKQTALLQGLVGNHGPKREPPTLPRNGEGEGK